MRNGRIRQQGMTLVEMMVGVTLGLVVLAGVASVFTSTGEVNRSNENIARLQEGARTAFTLMANDIREAGLNDCGRLDQVANVLNNAATTPWANWIGGLLGVDGGTAMDGVTSGTGVGQRVEAEDALRVMGAVSSGLSATEEMNEGATSAEFKLTGLSTLQPGDVVIVCDFEQASIAQISQTRTSTIEIVINTGGSTSPGNCTKGLGWPALCTTNGNSHSYGKNSSIMRMKSNVWFVGYNGRAGTAGTSLYRSALQNTGGTISTVVDEVVEGVSGIQFQYLLDGASNYVDATAVGAANWGQVISVKVDVTMQGISLQRGASGARERVTRTFSNVVTLRNRVS